MNKEAVVKDRPILVVDDDENMLIALYEALTRSGRTVATASSGVDAMDRLEEGVFSMVITDVKMPGMGGLEVLREVRRREPALPVVMVTAYGTVEDAVRAMKEGAFDYIMKPFSTDALETVVSRALRVTAGNIVIKTQDGPDNGSPDREIVGCSPKIRTLIDTARRVASTDATVLIEGESGTGKELFARFIHGHSDRRNKPFIAINCAALPEGLLESELFGHEKGSFTGAVSKKVGKFEQAQGGTLLLDEIGEMKPELQAKLLRVLQDRQMDRVGGRAPIYVDIRVIATTNCDLGEALAGGSFREDLYYRLNVIPFSIPPLRERKEDVPLLVDFFLRKHSGANGRVRYTVSSGAMEKLIRYHWPGNVRELENVLERAVVLGGPGVLSPGCFVLEGEMREWGRDRGLKAGISVKALEKNLILETLKETGGNRTRAAKLLGISLRTLRNRLKEYRESGSGETQLMWRGEGRNGDAGTDR